MTKQRILHGASALAAGLVIATGVGVAGASSGGYGGYGGGHNNNKNSGVSVDNDNDVTVTNTTNQNAVSGDATVEAGKNGGKKHHGCWEECGGGSGGNVAGDATTGPASNDSTSAVDVEITNEGLCDCLGELGGSDGHRRSSSLSIDNDNDVTVTNTTNQNAVSGDATVNGSGGNATTGSASNVSNSSVTVKISN